jgi:hypothetical protein
MAEWVAGVLAGGPERYVAAAYGITLAVLVGYGVSLAREARRLRAEISRPQPNRG